jgi:hypothetical protein
MLCRAYNDGPVVHCFALSPSNILFNTTTSWIQVKYYWAYWPV